MIQLQYKRGQRLTKLSQELSHCVGMVDHIQGCRAFAEIQIGDLKNQKWLCSYFENTRQRTKIWTLAPRFPVFANLFYFNMADERFLCPFQVLFHFSSLFSSSTVCTLDRLYPPFSHMLNKARTPRAQRVNIRWRKQMQTKIKPTHF
jgi:hypothetical protein